MKTNEKIIGRLKMIINFDKSEEKLSQIENEESRNECKRQQSFGITNFRACYLAT